METRYPSQPNRLLLLVLSDALHGDIKQKIPFATFRTALRDAENKINASHRLFFQPTDATLERNLQLLEQFCFIERKDGSIRLTALGDSACVAYHLPPHWQNVIPLIQAFFKEQLPEANHV